MDVFNVKNLVGTLISFIETKIEIYKIQFKEEAAKAVSALIILGLFAMFGLLFVLFLSLFISQLINELANNKYIGFISVAGIYLIAGFIIYLLRKKIQTNVTNFIFSEETENINKEEEKE